MSDLPAAIDVDDEHTSSISDSSSFDEAEFNRVMAGLGIDAGAPDASDEDSDVSSEDPSQYYLGKEPSAPVRTDTFPLGVDEERWRGNTITVRERAMLFFINTITDKPLWWEKVHDENIVAKWKTELDGFVEAGHDPLQNGFTDKMFDFCLRELRDKAALYDKTTIDGNGGIVSVLDNAAAVFKADGRVPPSLIEELKAAVEVFENVPEKEKDWHPGSNDQVLDLVHPSLWPLVYGTSRALDREIGIDNAVEYIGAGETIPVPNAAELGLSEKHNVRMWSKKFQWLPADVSFGPDGKGPAKLTSYINNAHPVEHRALYPIIEQLVDLALPMLSAAYDRVMTWSTCNDNTVIYSHRKRIQCDTSERYCTVPEYCKGEDGPGHCQSWKAPASALPEGMTDDDDDYWELSEAWFHSTHPVEQPDASSYVFPGIRGYQTTGPWFPTAKRVPVGPADAETIAAAKAADEERNAAFSATKSAWEADKDGDIAERLEKVANAAEDERIAAIAKPLGTDHRLQVIVKLANIHLTPENPSYPGGSWHFEGQINEHICATALFYYDNHNVTESRLAFRCIADAEEYTEGGFEYEQNDHKPFEEVYGMDPGLDCDTTAQALGDVVTREGRLLVFPNVLQHQVQPFELVDKLKSGHRKIVAIFLVDPNVRVRSTATVPPQQSHWRTASVVDSRLPPEISQMVYEHVDVPYPLDTAKKFREELIDERKALVQHVDEIIEERSWSFCEH